MNKIAIRVENLSKQYQIGSLSADRHFAYKSLRDTIARRFAIPFAVPKRSWAGKHSE